MIVKQKVLRHRFIKFWRSVFCIWCREYIVVRKNTEALVFFFLLTLAYPLLYALIYNPEEVRNVPVMVVDDVRNELSRSLVKRLDATSGVLVKGYSASLDEARHRMMSGDCYGIIYIPSQLYSQVESGERGTVVCYCDMSLLLNYKTLMMSITEVVLDVSSEVRNTILPIGLSQSIIDVVSNPVPHVAITMYNPDSGIASFLIPAVLILVLQQSLVLALGTLAGSERECRRMGYYYRFSTLSILMGKSLCYFSLYLFSVIYLFHFVPYLFGYPQLGNIVDIYAFILPFFMASMFFAMTLSQLVREREYAFLLFVFTSVIFIFISGIAWPRYAMPLVWRCLGWLIPSTWGIEGFVSINTTGADLHQVGHEYMALWIQTVGYAVTAYMVYRYRAYVCGNTKR